MSYSEAFREQLDAEERRRVEATTKSTPTHVRDILSASGNPPFMMEPSRHQLEERQRREVYDAYNEQRPLFRQSKLNRGKGENAPPVTLERTEFELPLKMMRGRDFMPAALEALMDDRNLSPSAVAGYVHALRAHHEEARTSKQYEEDLQEWASLMQARQINSYYLEPEVVQALQAEYDGDPATKHILHEMQASNLMQGASTTSPTVASSPTVDTVHTTTHTNNVATTGDMLPEPISSKPKQKFASGITQQTFAEENITLQSRPYLQIPAEPNQVNSDWAKTFHQVLDNAIRNGYYIPDQLISSHLNEGIQVLLECAVPEKVPAGVRWETQFSFLDMLKLVIETQKGGTTQKPKSSVEKLLAMPMKLSRFTVQNEDGPIAMVSFVHSVLQPTNHPKVELTQAQHQTILLHFQHLLESEKGEDRAFYSEVRNEVFLNQNNDPPKTIEDFVRTLAKVVTDICNQHTKVLKCAKVAPMELSQSSKRKLDDRDFHNKHSSKTSQPKAGGSKSTNSVVRLCNTCGRNLAHKDSDHERGQRCPYSEHPNANRASCSWSQSQQGKALQKLGWAKLPPTKMLQGDALASLSDEELKKVYAQHPRILETIQAKKEKTFSTSSKKVSDIFTRNSISYLDEIDSFNPHVFGRIAETKIGNGILDSGSFGYIANYISFDAYEKLAKLGLATSHKCKDARVCSLSSCFMNNTCTTFQLEVYSASVHRNITIPFTARIVKGLPYEFIIGLPSVRKYKLTRVFDYIFNDSEVKEATERNKRQRENSDSRGADTTKYRRQWKRPHATVQTDPIPSGFAHISVSHGAQGDEHHCDSCGDRSTLYCIQCSSQRTYSSAFTVETLSGPYLTHAPAATASLDSVFLNNCIRERNALLRNRLRADARNVLMPIVHRDVLLDQEDDTDHLDEYLDESPHDMLLNNEIIVEQGLDKMTIQGTDEFRENYATFVQEFESRFRSSLGPIAAYLEPFRLELTDKSTWFSSAKHQLAPRQMSRAKEIALDNFVQKALATDLIEESQAPSWSLPHLIPKPDGTYRFTEDFRFLNENTESLGWPLPNIRQMLERIGAKKPKVFAVLDLTQGYYQMAISVESRALTAFRTSKGLYQWKRLPMGLKGAPAYFQHAMQSTVLGGLLQNICEVYLDDIIVYAQSEEELLQNLRQVFVRLEQYNITLNPAKVKVGLTSVEYVGHKIDSEGLSFSEAKREDVWTTPLPKTRRELKSFLGLCVQFKDHVRNYSSLVAPLHALLPNYSKKEANKPVSWTEETRKTFSDTQKAVNECPKIFFVDPNAPVVLHTDASNYGIGGYLFQIIDGVETPIMFLSKGLNKTERKWSVYEKEGYAIFYSFMKMEHLLRDSKFLLRTDHQNLTFINTDMRDKVKRWKLAIQHFDFDVEHIKGELNIEADGFSRLIETPDGEPREVIVQNAINAMRTKRPTLEVLPTATYKKIKDFHNAVIGHHGIERTLQKLSAANQNWEGMRKDVKLFIDRCPCCQKMSAIKPLIHTMPFTLASYSPFDRICVDTIGPLPTDSDSGSEYILVIIDAFSRFVKLYSIKDTSAKAALNSLLDWVGMFGIPSEMVSDNGTQFANELVEQFLSIIATTDAKIHAYSSEENGIVERANKEVLRHLKTLVYNRKVKSKWATYLPLVQRIMNASVHTTLGVSPAQLVFGNAVRLDRNLLPEIPLQMRNSEKAVNVYLEDLLETQREIVQIALRNQIETDEFHIANRGGNQPITEFPINSYVLVNYEGNDHRPPSKLHTFLRGPLRIVNRNGSIYTLENLVKNKLEDFHVKLLHPFKFDAAIVDPKEVAQHDEDHFGIVQVLNHRFKSARQNRHDLEFLIEFDDDSEPVWQPWSPDIRDNEQIHAYLNRNHMRKFIPIKYTYPKDHPLYEKPEPKEKGSSNMRKKKRKFGKY